MRERILHAAGGNPLFVEEMAAMVESSGDGEVEVPPTLQALLAARLDQLDAPERSVLERGAVEGEVFHHGVVQALTPEEPRLTTQLTALVRKELIRPDRPCIAGDDAYRFRHLLMRDAAYDALPKAERAELHERFADWLAEHGAELVELDELVGYHLEQALPVPGGAGHSSSRISPHGPASGWRTQGTGRSCARTTVPRSIFSSEPLPCCPTGHTMDGSRAPSPTHASTRGTVQLRCLDWPRRPIARPRPATVSPSSVSV